MAFNRVRHFHANNLATLRNSPLSEISGSLGDLGTLLPLMIALAVNNSISLSTTLVLSGLWNILTGAAFGIPLPVQPMKAIAAVAISRNFSIEETISAGFTTSSIVLIFSATGMLRWFTRVIPTPVVKGIQVGAGLSLILSAGSTLLQPLGWTTPNAGDNLLWAVFAFLFLLVSQKMSRVPYALIIFILGVIIATTSTSQLPSFRIWQPSVYIPSIPAFKHGALSAGLGQVPLTTLNSIIAVHYLSADLLPNIPAPSVTSIGLSVAAMNLIGGWFGAMPVCHGSGGLAAQYRFGARSGASIILLGIFKVLLGLVFGETLVELLKGYPKGLLGVMVLAAGIELAKVGESLNYGARDLWQLSDRGSSSDARSGFTPAYSSSEHAGSRHEGEGHKTQRHISDAERQQRWMVMFTTIAGLLAFKNDGVGFAAGMLCHFTYRSGDLWEHWAQSSRLASALRLRSRRSGSSSGQVQSTGDRIRTKNQDRGEVDEEQRLLVDER